VPIEEDDSRGILTIDEDGDELRVWYEAAERGGGYRLSGFDTQSGWGVDINHTFCVSDDDDTGCNRSSTDRSFGMFGVREVDGDLQVFYLGNSAGTFGYQTDFETQIPTAQAFIAQGNDEMAFVRYSYRTFFGPSPSDRRVEFKGNPVDFIWDTFAVGEAGGGQLVFHRQVVSADAFLDFAHASWDHEAAALRQLVVSNSDASAFIRVDYESKRIAVSSTDSTGPSAEFVVGDLISDFGYTCYASPDYREWGGDYADPERCPLVAIAPSEGAPDGLRFELPNGIAFSDLYNYGLGALGSLMAYDLRLEDPFVAGSPLPNLIDDEIFRNGMRKERWAELWLR
jgi:hypothetical protein